MAKYTVHGVLAGAYKGRDISERALLRHASTDEGHTALCGTVKADSLCDMEEEGLPTCEKCLAKVAKRNLEKKE
jgi:hypothetical protein